ncbi:MAG: hypothetical protein QXD43_03715 [Candidatus Aenigmatarchaeota archaeon]
MVQEKEDKILQLGLTADEVEVNDNYVIFNKEGYESLKKPFQYVASIIHEYNPFKLACDLGILRSLYKNKNQD